MASLIGVSSVYQTHALEFYKRATTTTTTAAGSTTAVSLPSLSFDNKSHFDAVLRAHLNGIASKRRVGFVPSAVVTANSSVVSEEAFKGFGLDGVGHEREAGYDYESEGPSPPSALSEDELDISKLGLPSPLVDSLQKRGITSLFPIQVSIVFLVFNFYFILIFICGLITGVMLYC